MNPANPIRGRRRLVALSTILLGAGLLADSALRSRCERPAPSGRHRSHQSRRARLRRSGPGVPPDVVEPDRHHLCAADGVSGQAAAGGVPARPGSCGFVSARVWRRQDVDVHAPQRVPLQRRDARQGDGLREGDRAHARARDHVARRHLHAGDRRRRGRSGREDRHPGRRRRSWQPPRRPLHAARSRLPCADDDGVLLRRAADASGRPRGSRPFPAAGPYYVAEYRAGQRVVIRRNRFYRGARPHHVDGFVVDLGRPRPGGRRPDRARRGRLGLGAADLLLRTGSAVGGEVRAEQIAVLRQAGARPSASPSTPRGRCFADNPRLRRAVNFAVDRRALGAARGRAVRAPDRPVPAAGIPGFQDARIYPFTPDLRKARALARGHTRNGKVVLYTQDVPIHLARAQIVAQNLAKIGLDVEVKGIAPNAYFGRTRSPRRAVRPRRSRPGSRLPRPVHLHQRAHGRALHRLDQRRAVRLGHVQRADEARGAPPGGSPLPRICATRCRAGT